MSKFTQTRPNGAAFETDEAKWEAVASRDVSADGAFVFAVVSTGIFCRPSCPARRPRRENVRFFATAAEAERAGFRACKRCAPNAPMGTRAELVKTVCDYIEAHLNEPLTLAVLSEWTGVSPYHLQRTFRAVAGISPREYIDACRLRAFKDGVRSGQSVTEAQVEAGYASSSRLYERSDGELGMTPATYGRGGQGAAIRYVTAQSDLGSVLVATTDRGVCSVQLGDSADELVARLRAEYPLAEITKGEGALLEDVQAILAHLEGQKPNLELPTDVRATAFQRRVWDYLRTIPRGETRSYGEVAEAIGEPEAVRAVARACASNQVALTVPCHRVIRADGSLGGYRWGVERKRKLLERERE